MEQIKETIKNQNPLLKDTSIEHYAKSIFRLHQAMVGTDEPFDNLDFLKDIDELKVHQRNGDIVYLNTFSMTTIRNFYSAIILMLQSEDTPDKKLIQKYQAVVRGTAKKYEEENNTGIVSKRQQDKLLKMDQIDKLLAEAKKEDNKMNYILFKFIILYHLRNEIAELRYITPTNYKKLTKEERDDGNFLIVGTKKITMKRGKFKTNKRYGIITTPIEDKVFQKELRDYLKTLNNDIVFPYNGEMMDRKRLSNHLIYNSKKYIGFGLSTTMIAKSVLSHKYEAQQSKQKVDAKNRGHSVNTQNMVYIKRLPDEQGEKEFTKD